MGNLILGINTEFDYFFETKTQREVDDLVTDFGSAKLAAAAQNEETVIRLVVDLVTIANNLTPPDVQVDTNTGQVNLVFRYQNLAASKLNRTAVNVSWEKFNTNYVLTTVTLVEQTETGSIPNSDSAAVTCAVPDDDDVPGKGQPD